MSSNTPVLNTRLINCVNIDTPKDEGADKVGGDTGEGPFPNATWPSDHLLLISTLAM